MEFNRFLCLWPWSPRLLPLLQESSWFVQERKHMASIMKCLTECTRCHSPFTHHAARRMDSIMKTCGIPAYAHVWGAGQAWPLSYTH